MSSKDWKPWWEKISDYDTPHEKEEFMRGMVGAKPRGPQISASNIFLGLLAGYVGGKAASSRNKR